MGVQGAGQGVEQTTVTGGCVEGQGGGNIVGNSNQLRSVSQEVQKPIAVHG